MSRFRFSLAGLLGFVTVAAIGFVVLRNASEVWGQVMFTSAVAVLLFGVLAAMYRRRQARAFWVGFLVFGWAYMVMVYGPWFEGHVGRRLVTTGVLGSVHATLQKPTQVLFYRGDDEQYLSQLESSLAQTDRSLAHVEAVGQPLFALLFALVGGVAGRWVYGGREGTQ